MMERTFKADNLTVKIFASREAMGKAAAEEAAEYMKALIATKGDINVVFAAAPSQNEFLASLAAAQGIAWDKVHAFHMDEYVGLPADAPQGFGNFLNRAIFSKVPFASVEYIGTDSDSEKTCRRYAALLAEHPIDIVFMGIGENGHIAFNDPHVADFNDPLLIKKVDLDLKCRNQQVHDGCFKTLEEVPEYAVTLTIPELMSADRLFCIVPASTKAVAVRNTVQGIVSELCPATAMRKHKCATLYLDQDSSKFI